MIKKCMPCSYERIRYNDYLLTCVHQLCAQVTSDFYMQISHLTILLNQSLLLFTRV